MDESLPMPQSPYHLLLKPVRKRVIWGMAAFLLLFLVLPGCFSIMYAFSHHQTIAGRSLFLALAAVALFLPGWVAFVCIRRRVTTGSWQVSNEERLRNRAKWAASQTPARTKRMNAALWVADIAPLLVGAEFFWLSLRPNHRPPDWSDILVLVLWGFLAVLALWRIVTRFSKSPPSAPAAGSLPPGTQPS